MRSAETALKGKDTAPLAALYISFELGDKHWTLTISDGLRRPSHYAVAAGDKAAVLETHLQSRGALRPACASAGALVLRGRP